MIYFFLVLSHMLALLKNRLWPVVAFVIRVAAVAILQTGRTALMNAAWQNRADCARLLIDAGADKEARDKVRVVCSFQRLSREVQVFYRADVIFQFC